MITTGMTSDGLRAELTEMLISRGAAMVGFAGLGEISDDLRMGLPTGISIGAAFSRDILAGIAEGPTVEYYAEDQRVRALLRSLAAFTADYLAQRGYKAVAVAGANAGYNREMLSTRLPHKTAATRAGLGWIGKTAVLVTRQFGSAVSLTTVLTDAPLPVGQAIDASQCGECRVCVDVCPAGAATGLKWQKDMERSSFFDASACRSTGLEFSAKMGVEENCCGMCIAACPWTKAYIKRETNDTGNEDRRL